MSNLEKSEEDKILIKNISKQAMDDSIGRTLIIIFYIFYSVMNKNTLICCFCC